MHLGRVTTGVVALALLAGCGGDGKGTAAKGTRAKRAIQTEAQARAESMVLELSDFPDGWRATTPEDDDATTQQFRKCLGSDYSTLTIIGDTNSKDFAIEDSTNASSDATVFASESEAEDAYNELAAGMGSTAAGGCFRDLIEPSLKKVDPELAVGDVEVGELGVTAPQGIIDTKAWQIAISIEATSGAEKGTSATAYLDFVELRQGDSVATVQTGGVVTPFDPDLRNELLQAVARRMSQAGTA